MRDLETTVRSRELGLALQRAARAQGLNASHIARQLGWSPSRMSRLYTGKRGSGSRDDIIAVLAVCGITGPKRDELLELSHDAYRDGWWQEFGDRLPPELCSLSNYEDAAIAMTNYETRFIPGLLQTPAYMRALMRRSPVIPGDEIDMRIEARRRRQRILNDPSRCVFVFFIDEYALLRTGPGDGIMREQVHHLLEIGVRLNVQIRIIPDAVGIHAGREPFKIMRFTEFKPIVFIETQTSVLFLERKDTVAGYRRIVENLSTVALDARRSLEALANLATDLAEPEEDHDEPAPPLEEEFPN